MNAFRTVVRRSSSRLATSRVRWDHHLRNRSLSTAPTTPAWTVQAQPFYSVQSSPAAVAVEPASTLWAMGMVAVILSANIFAIWAELNMTPKESLLQGLAEAGRAHQQQQRAENDNMQARRRARIIHFRLPGQ